MTSPLNRRLRTLEGKGAAEKGVVFYANLTAFTDDRLRLMTRCTREDGELDGDLFDALTPDEQADLKFAFDDVEAQHLEWERAGRPRGENRRGFANG